MPTLTLPKKASCLVGLLVLLAWAVGCNDFFAKDVCISVSPNGVRRVIVSERRCAGECTTSIDVVAGRSSRRISDEHGTLTGFVEVAWSPNSDRVSIFVFNSFRPPTVLGYDFGTDRLIPADESAIKTVIQKRYGLAPNYFDTHRGAVAGWCQEEGRFRFHLDRSPNVIRPIELSYVPS
jgi:hypothetical protein